MGESFLGKTGAGGVAVTAAKRQGGCTWLGASPTAPWGLSVPYRKSIYTLPRACARGKVDWVHNTKQARLNFYLHSWWSLPSLLSRKPLIDVRITDQRSPPASAQSPCNHKCANTLLHFPACVHQSHAPRATPNKTPIVSQPKARQATSLFSTGGKQAAVLKDGPCHLMHLSGVRASTWRE